MYSNDLNEGCCSEPMLVPKREGLVERIKMLDEMMKELNDILYFVKSTMTGCNESHPADSSCKSPSCMDEAIDCLIMETKLAIDKARMIRDTF